MDDSIRLGISHVLELRRDYDKRMAEVDKIARRMRREREALGKRIRDGETTGDKIRDFLLVCHQVISLDIEGKEGQYVRELDALYRNLDSMTRGRAGSPILLVEDDMKENRKSMVAPPTHDLRDYFGTRTTFSLGILKGDMQLDLWAHKVVFPTGGHYAVADMDQFPQKWELVNYDLKIWVSDVTGYLMKSQPQVLALLGEKKPDKTLQVLVGDDVLRRFDGPLKSEYARALELLGEPVPEPYAEALATKRRNQKVGLVKSIVNLSRKTSVGRNQSLDPDYESLLRNLKEARDLGLFDDHEFTFDMRPGETIKVSQYLSEIEKIYSPPQVTAR